MHPPGPAHKARARSPPPARTHLVRCIPPFSRASYARQSTPPSAQGKGPLGALRSLPEAEDGEDGWRQLAAELGGQLAKTGEEQRAQAQVRHPARRRRAARASKRPTRARPAAEAASPSASLPAPPAAPRQAAKAEAAELRTRVGELSATLDALGRAASDAQPELLFRAAELEGLLALRDVQVRRLLRALRAQRSRVASAAEDLSLALALFPSLALTLDGAWHAGEPRGAGSASLLLAATQPQPPAGRGAALGSSAPPARSAPRSAHLDLRPITPGVELHVAPRLASRPETAVARLASQNRYRPADAPALRPARPRTSSGLHRSMSEHAAAAAELSLSLKGASLDGSGRVTAPSPMQCDRAFSITALPSHAGRKTLRTAGAEVLILPSDS